MAVPIFMGDICNVMGDILNFMGEILIIRAKYQI
jgi:hypothetical protein